MRHGSIGGTGRWLIGVLLGLMLTVLAAPAGPTAVRGQSAATDAVVDTTWLMGAATDPNLVIADLRGGQAYAAGHIPGAVPISIQTLVQASTDDDTLGPWQTTVAQALGAAGIGADSLVVAYDDDGDLYAARLWWALAYLGHDRVRVLDGGLAAWTAAGGAVETAPAARPPATLPVAVQPERLATWSYVVAHLDDPDVQIVDVRTPAEYTGSNSSGARRAGHVPGALNLDWNNNVLPVPPRRFKSQAELQAQYDALGLQREREIIIYCSTGIRSANTYLVLRWLGYPRLRLYSGSWQEWGNRDDLPIRAGTEP